MHTTATRWLAAAATGTLLLTATTIATTPTTAAPGVAAGAPDPRAGARCEQPGPYPLPQGSDPVRLDPADFTTRIDNRYFPMRPGTTWHYVERGDGSTTRATVRVTHRTKNIRGITARVVHDTVRERGQLVEDTHDWYAQDSGGNLWYLGEHSVTYEDGRPVSTEGSWVHGRHGAQAGVIMPADPTPGCGYREEYRPGVARDRARILSDREALEGPTGSYSHVVQTANTTPLDPAILENKFYAPGIGPVLELDVSPDIASAELVRITHGPSGR